MSGISSHPNAIIGGVIGAGGLGPLTIWLLNDVFHWGIPPAAAAGIAGGVGALLMLIGRDGLVGIARLVWYGKRPAAAPPTSPPVAAPSPPPV